MPSPFNISGEIKIEKNGKLFLNKKRIELLRLIIDTGSIRSAAKTMDISYQLAWMHIREINALSPQLIIDRQRGGINGGGATITKYGLELVEKYILLEKKQNIFLRTNTSIS